VNPGPLAKRNDFRDYSGEGITEELKIEYWEWDL
jgi:hypothetical protein